MGGAWNYFCCVDIYVVLSEISDIHFKKVGGGMFMTPIFTSDLCCTYGNRDFTRTLQYHLPDYCKSTLNANLPPLLGA